MKLIEKFSYTPLERHTPLGGIRYYVCPETGNHLPSVTSILDSTADKSGLLEWRKRVGEKEAERIKHEALGLGTLVHTHLECYIEGRDRPSGNNLVRQQAEAMADQVIQYGLSNVLECWGSEVMLYFPGLYAGTMDGIGLYRLPDGRVVEAILDFKTARVLRKKEHIQDYFAQLAAYALAHNELQGTNIEAGVIFMVDRDFQYREFIIEGDDFAEHAASWLDRLDQYYATK